MDGSPKLAGSTSQLVQLLAASLTTLRCLAAAAANQLKVAQAGRRGIQQQQAAFVEALLCLAPGRSTPNNVQLLWQLLEWQQAQQLKWQRMPGEVRAEERPPAASHASTVASKAWQLLHWCLQQSALHLEPVITATISSLPLARDLAAHLQGQLGPFCLVRSLLHLRVQLSLGIGPIAVLECGKKPESYSTQLILSGATPALMQDLARAVLSSGSTMPKVLEAWGGDSLGALRAAVESRNDQHAARTPAWDGFRRAGPAGLAFRQESSASGSSGLHLLSGDAMDSAAWGSKAVGPGASAGWHSPPAVASQGELGPRGTPAATPQASQPLAAAASEVEAKKRLMQLRLETLKAQIARVQRQILGNAAGSSPAPPPDPAAVTQHALSDAAVSGVAPPTLAAPLAAQQEEEQALPQLPGLAPPDALPADSHHPTSQQQRGELRTGPMRELPCCLGAATVGGTGA
jgi:hypothetical protein